MNNDLKETEPLRLDLSQVPAVPLFSLKHWRTQRLIEQRPRTNGVAEIQEAPLEKC